MSDLTSKQRSDLSNAIWDALDGHGHNGLDCRPEKPMDYTADHAVDSITPILAAMLADAREAGKREGAAAVRRDLLEELDDIVQGMPTRRAPQAHGGIAIVTRLRNRYAALDPNGGESR